MSFARRSLGTAWFLYGLGGAVGFGLTVAEESADSTGWFGGARLSVYAACLFIAGLSQLVSPPIRPWLLLMGTAPVFVLAVVLFFAWFYPVHFVPLLILLAGFARAAQQAGIEQEVRSSDPRPLS